MHDAKLNLTDWQDARLLGPRLLIERWAPEEMSEGGIHLVESARRFYTVADIRKIGDGVDPDLGLNVGDTVIYGAAGPVPLEELGERMQYLHVDEVVLVYPKHQNKEPHSDGQETTNA